jgi:hypothetical protein
MDKALRVLRVFIASPGDLTDERKALRDVVEKINRIYARNTNCRIELLGWEDTLPGEGRPQELINRDLDKSDVFIGCVYTRWGTTAGASGETGFEEEFNRAIARREELGSPKIWLYFKKVDDLQRADPGEQLTKVLAFKEREIAAKRLLFKEFETTLEWKDMISEALHCEMLGFLSSQEATEQEGSSALSRPGESDHSTQSRNTLQVGSKELIEILASANTDLHSNSIIGKNEDSPRLRSERLYLYAAVNYEGSIHNVTLDVHEINRVYLNKERHTLTNDEKLFLVKCALLDSSDVIAGWYWLSRKKNIERFLFGYYSNIFYDPAVRRDTIKFATRIGYRLNKGKAAIDRPIEKSLKDQDPGVKIAALNHLAKFGLSRDLSSIDPLLSSENSLVREQAERTIRQIRLRITPHEEARKSFERMDPFDEDLLQAISPEIHRLESQVLWHGAKHSYAPLAARCVRELQARKEITSEAKIKILENSTCKAILEVAYMARVDLGEEIDLSVTRSRLKSYSYLDKAGEKGDADAVAERVFRKLSEDQLWEQLKKCDDNSHVALFCLARQFRDTSIDRIRDLVNEKFYSIEASAKVSADSNYISRLFGGDTSLQAARKRLVKAGFRILADRPLQSDRDLFLRGLSSDVSSIGETVSSCRGLIKVGKVVDLPELKKIWLQKGNFSEGLAAEAYLHISTNKEIAVRELLEDVTPCRIWIVVNHLIKTSSSKLWEVMEPHLRNNDPDVRRITCFYALRMHDKKSLIAILNRYQRSSSSYYYNVVCILDRICYSPKELAQRFMELEKNYFLGKKPDSEIYWNF